MEFKVIRILENLVLPPGGPLLLIFLGLLFWRRKLSVSLVFSGAVLLYLTAIPALTGWLNGSIEHFNVVVPQMLDSDAIVVIGGGRHLIAPEYGSEDNVNERTLERIRYAAWLQKRTGLPILVSGGRPQEETSSEAELMAKALREDFAADVRWLESESHNTFENAEYSAEVFKKHGVKNVVLVTHAFHMPRALEAFKKTGLEVVPAPTVYLGAVGRETPILNWLPDARAAFRNWLLLHEILGRWWYRYRYY